MEKLLNYRVEIKRLKKLLTKIADMDDEILLIKNCPFSRFVVIMKENLLRFGFFDKLDRIIKE